MGRHKAREEALKVLYALEVGRKDVEEVLKDAEELFKEEPQWQYTEQLVRTVRASLSEIDDEISPFAKEWPIHRMAAIDRTIMRMAVAEMLYFPDVPYEVTINEAVELAKTYGDAESGNFVNGILAGVHRHRMSVAKG